jgi:hypothetical protein
MNGNDKTFSKELEKALDYLIESARYVRRIDGKFMLRDKIFAYSAYRIEPASGNPIIRIDINLTPLPKE